MKCSQCGTEFDGKFCPECGAKNEAATPVMPSPGQQPTQQGYLQPTSTTIKPAKKKKKPFFLRWWFIVLAVFAVGIIALSINGKGEKIKWSDMVLGNMLPEPPANKGKIYDNSAKKLWVYINNLSDKQYNDYIDACMEKGFTVDVESSSSSYNAYNEEGYKLSLSHYGSNADMCIELEAPMEMSTIKWPASTAGNLLPAPKSITGKFSYEHDDSFFVYIGDMSKADYDEYVNVCSETGFSVDYSKGDNYYHADNAEGWHISLEYQGNHTMTIKISAPSENEDNSTPATSSTEEPESDTETEESTSEDNDNIDPNFKAAMDSYENFIDEYVAIVKKYSENPSDLELLSEYTDYMSKYADFLEDFEKWEKEEMNAAETAYYIEVQSRVSKKLLEIAQ